MFIEIVQFIFGLGSTDIDDLFFNVLGVVIGYLLYRVIKKKSNTNISAVISIIVLISVFGSIAIGVLFVNNTELFIIFPKKITVENKEIVQDFIDTAPYLSGKFIEFDGDTLTIEKNIKNSKEEKILVEMTIIPTSKVYVCYNTIDYFFSTISKEHISYEQLFYSDFIEASDEMFSKENNVLVWSMDEKNVNNIVIIEWVE